MSEFFKVWTESHGPAPFEKGGEGDLKCDLVSQYLAVLLQES